MMGCFDFLKTEEETEAGTSSRSSTRKSSVFKKLSKRFSKTTTESATGGALVAHTQDGVEAVKRKSSSLLRRSSKQQPPSVESRLEELIQSSSKPSEIASAYVAKGNLQLSKNDTDAACESFAFALSYSSPRTQHVALLHIAKAKYSQAKRQSKGSRSKTREEALENAEKAMQLVKRFKLQDEHTGELEALVKDIEGLPFKVAV